MQYFVKIHVDEMRLIHVKVFKRDYLIMLIGFEKEIFQVYTKISCNMIYINAIIKNKNKQENKNRTFLLTIHTIQLKFKAYIFSLEKFKVF